MNDIKSQIRKILTPVKQMKRAELLSRLSADYKITDRAMRKLISEEMPEIGSCHSRGYFIIATEKDLDNSMADLKSKAQSIYRRANSQFATFGKEFQINMLFK